MTHFRFPNVTLVGLCGEKVPRSFALNSNGFVMSKINLIVQITLRRQRSTVQVRSLQDGRQHLRHCRFAIAASNSHQRQIKLHAPVVRQLAKCQARVSHHNRMAHLRLCI